MLRWIAGFAIWAFVTFDACAVELTFSARYDSRSIYDGADVLTDTAFAPTAFTLMVTFDPTVSLRIGPSFSFATLTADDGSEVSYQAATANTVFGPTAFSPSPYSSTLQSGLGVAEQQVFIANTSENEAYNYYDGFYSSSGARSIASEIYEDRISSAGDRFFYNDEVYIGAGLGAPSGLLDVATIETPVLLAYLKQALTNRFI